MPGSVKHGKDKIKEWINSKNIKTIVDVGAGSATYPKLLGNKYKYIAIEIWEPYVKQWNLHKYYDEIIIADVSSRMMKWPKADCIIFGDVLEHIEKKRAFETLKEASVFYKHVVVSIPLDHYPAEIHYGNEYEAHLSEWGFQEMKNIHEWEVAYDTGKQIGIFMV